MADLCGLHMQGAAPRPRPAQRYHGRGLRGMSGWFANVPSTSIKSPSRRHAAGSSIPDGLVEIAEWESAEAQAAAVEQAAATSIYAPVVELVAAPFKATRIGRLS